MISPDPSETTPSDRPVPVPRRTDRWGRFVPLTAAGTGVVLVAVSAVLLLHNRGLPADFGAVPGDATQVQAVGSAPPSPSAVPAVSTPPAAPLSPSASRSPTTAQPVTGMPTTKTARTIPSTVPPRTTTARPSSAALPATAKPRVAAVDPRALPRQLVLPRFGVRADVLPVTSSNGVLEVPENPQQVGWWVGSALPGSTTGSTVMDGHIDSATAGVGALIHLSELVPGDHVSIVGSTGTTLDYDVVARRVYVKNAGLPSSLFAAGGPERLLLISCGGPFDSARGSYEDNIVVFATPSAN